MATQDAKPTNEKQTKSEKQTKWYPFFPDSDNTYINDLALRAKRSPTHGAILQSKAVYTAGEDFIYYKDGKPVPFEELDSKFQDWVMSVNSDNDSLHWLFGKCAYDYIYSGNTYLEAQKGKESLYLFYQDATKHRVSDKDSYISAFWRDIKNNSSYSDSEYPTAIVPLWDGKVDTNQKNFIIHTKNDTPEYDYYGLPENIQALKWADIEYKIAQFNLDMFKNGFFPSVAIDLFGQAPQGMTDQQYVESIKKSFTDEGNNSKMFIQLLDDPTQSAKITEFTTTRDGQFTEMQQLATQQIISSHRWFASLAGLQTAGSLGSNQQIRNEYNIALKGLIIPQFQKPLLRLFNNVVKMAGFDYELGIMNVAPVGIEDKIEPKEVLTKNEQRELLGFEPLEDNELTDNNGNDNGDNNNE